MKKICLLVPLIPLLGLAAQADNLQYGEEQFSNVYITETDEMYYIQVPETGEIINRQKQNGLGCVLDLAPEAERLQLKNEFNSRFKKIINSRDKELAQQKADLARSYEKKIREDEKKRAARDAEKIRIRQQAAIEQQAKEAPVQATTSQTYSRRPLYTSTPSSDPRDALSDLHKSVALSTGNSKMLSDALKLDDLDARAKVLQEKAKAGNVTESDRREAAEVMEGYKGFLK
jgi:hypothetical protein